MRQIMLFAAVVLGVTICLRDPSRSKAAPEGAGKAKVNVKSSPAPSPDAPDKAKSDFLRQLGEQGIWTIVVFIGLFLILKKFAWRPMLDGLQQREANIRTALEEADKARQEAKNLRDHYDAEIKKASENAREIIEEARRDAIRLLSEERARAKAEIQTERDRLYRDLSTAKDQAMQEMWNQSAKLATMISAKALRREVNADDHQALLEDALGEMRGAVDEKRAFIGTRA